MKRSEAIRLINERFQWDILGKDVLKFMEEYIGMLPPQIEKPITYRSDLNPSLELLTVTKTVNEWEPENES